MNLKYILIIQAVFLLHSFSPFSSEANGQIVEEIKKGLETGDVDLIARYFNETLTLNIEGNESEMNKADAKKELKDFFSKHSVNRLIIKFEGEKSRSNFLIATLVTSQGDFRINIFFKKTETESFIHLLRIEKVNEPSF